MTIVRARATTERIIDPNVIENVENLLLRFNTIQLANFSDLYRLTFEKSLCASALGFNGGLLGFFEEIRDVVRIHTHADGSVYLTLTDNHKRKLNNQSNAHMGSLEYNPDEVTISDNLDPEERKVAISLFKDEEVWPEDLCHLKGYSNYIFIARSPLEALYNRNPYELRMHVEAITNALSRFPEGVPLDQINRIVRVDCRFFRVNGIAECVANYPEIFFSTEAEDTRMQPTVFAGVSHTISEEGLKSMDEKKSVKLVLKAVRSGFYQMTLILLNAAGHQGLKLTVWFETLKENFGRENTSHQEDLFSQKPIDVARALYKHGLLSIESGRTIKNDLRLKIKKTLIDIGELKESLSKRNEEFNELSGDQLSRHSSDENLISTSSGSSGSC